MELRSMLCISKWVLGDDGDSKSFSTVSNADPPVYTDVNILKVGVTSRPQKCPTFDRKGLMVGQK